MITITTQLMNVIEINRDKTFRQRGMVNDEIAFKDAQIQVSTFAASANLCKRLCCGKTIYCCDWYYNNSKDN